MPSLNAFGNPIVGTVDSGGLSATFAGVVHLSTVVGLVLVQGAALTSVPPSASLSSTADFAFTAGAAGGTFACSLDGNAFTPCTSPKSYTGLVNGNHSFQVQATDAANNVDPTPASYSWTIDLGTDYQVLHYFALRGPLGEGPDYSLGAIPEAPLLRGSDGLLYGTTGSGGAFGGGTAFRIDSSGNFLRLGSFPSGTEPFGRLIQATDGSFYGTSLYGPIYKFDPAGNLTPLHSLNYYTEGAAPRAGVTQGTDGDFFGTAWTGGDFGTGTVFRMDGAGSVTVLHAFAWDGTEGAGPYTTLIQGTDGNFFGTTQGGGAFNAGTVFRVTTAGALTVLHSFDSATEGGSPMGGLLLAERRILLWDDYQFTQYVLRRDRLQDRSRRSL